LPGFDVFGCAKISVVTNLYATEAHLLTDQRIVTRFTCFYCIMFWFVGTVSEYFFRDLSKKGGVLTGLE